MQTTGKYWRTPLHTVTSHTPENMVYSMWIGIVRDLLYTPPSGLAPPQSYTPGPRTGLVPKGPDPVV